jgi:hypothetical protein
MSVNFWVRSQHDLKTAVKNEAIYFVTAYAATYAIGCLKQYS